MRTVTLGKSVNVAQNDIKDLSTREKQTRKDITTLQSDMASAQTTISKLLEANNKLERFSRKNNLRLVGYPETQNEKPHKIVKDVLKDDFGLPYIEVDKAHRRGKSVELPDKTKVPRQIIFKVLRHTDKVEIFKRKREALENKDYYITDDLTDQDLEKKTRLQPVIDKALSENRKVKFVDGTLIVDRKAYKGSIPPKPEKQDRRTRPTLIGKRFNQRRNSQSPSTAAQGEFTFTLPDSQAK